MRPTTQTTLASISVDDLATITGGCGKKKCTPRCPPQPQPVVQGPAPSAPEVSTSVSVSYG
jgi:hypothetical protein